jgi:transcriptional regulator of acetoin/glycerol metabolism
VDVRIVSATHADVDALVERGAFRRDLYARLARRSLRSQPMPVLRCCVTRGQ